MSRDGSYSRLKIDVDLAVEIDGQPAQLKGQGDQLTLVLGGRETLYRLLESNSRVAGKAADRLATLGLTLTVSDQNQSLAKAGYGVTSRVSELVTGSRHISPTSFSSLVEIARAYLVARRK